MQKKILHVQDFEIDAMFGLFLNHKEPVNAPRNTGTSAIPGSRTGTQRVSFVQKLVFGVEKWVTNSFDRVSSISFSMLENAGRKGVPEHKRLFFPNWVDTSFVTPEVDGSSIRERFGYGRDDLVVLYSGNLGEKQGLEIVLEAAALFLHHKGTKAQSNFGSEENAFVSSCLRGENIKFCIVGNGASKVRLEQQAEEQNLTNVKFFPVTAL